MDGLNKRRIREVPSACTLELGFVLYILLSLYTFWCDQDLLRLTLLCNLPFRSCGTVALERYHVRQVNYSEGTPLSYFLTGDTRMEGVLRYQSSCKAYRAHLTRIYNKVSKIMESGKTPSDSQITTLKSSLEQLQRKAEIIRDLDAKIVQATQDPSELEAEIFESEEIQDTIIKKTGSIKEFLSCHVQSGVPVKTRVTQTLDASAQPFSTQHQDSLTSTDEPLPSNRSSTDSRPSVQIHDSATLSVSRLPKLNLPIFSGEPLSWQTFWDSFSAAVDSNHSLSGVQKFNYLKAQIQGDTARAIAGFPLTDAN